MTGASSVRILLADDHLVVRRGLRLVLESEPGFEVVCEAGDGIEAVEQAVANDIDLAVLDITMPRMGGLQAAREIAQRRPRTRILMLSVHDDQQYIEHTRQACAHGYVLKAMADHDLIRACRQVVAAEPSAFVQPPSQPALIQRTPAGRAGPGNAALTPREAEILALIAEGHTAKQIAQMLVISPRTVDRHRENLLGKLDLRNSTELTRYAIRIGLVQP
jgi:DNA-binding NarL/FixJ family response regulator